MYCFCDNQKLQQKLGVFFDNVLICCYQYLSIIMTYSPFRVVCLLQVKVDGHRSVAASLVLEVQGYVTNVIIAHNNYK